MEKIAQALDVPMQMLFPIDTCTPEGIATLRLNMQLQFGSMEIVEVDGSVSLKFPKNEFSKTATDTLHTVKQLGNAETVPQRYAMRMLRCKALLAPQKQAMGLPRMRNVVEADTSRGNFQ